MGKHGQKQMCTCQICGKQVLKGPTMTRKKFYCSPECKKASRTVQCDYCGKEIFIIPSEQLQKNYCSEECKEKAGYNCKCDYCGKEYKARRINGRGNFCSEECEYEYWHPKCVCEYCGKTYRRDKSKIKSHTYCSNECRKESNKAKTTRCIMCGKEFAIYDYTDPNKFCSNKCTGKYYGAIKSRNARIKNKEARMKNDEMRLKKEMISELKKETKEIKKRINKLGKIEECQYCGETFISRRGAIYCSQPCKNKTRNRRKDKRLSRNGKPDMSISLIKLYKRDKGICKLCGRRTFFVDDYQSDGYPSIDHIMPISKGGKHEWSNVQLAHRGCNDKKSNKIPPPSVKNS